MSLAGGSRSSEYGGPVAHSETASVCLWHPETRGRAQGHTSRHRIFINDWGATGLGGWGVEIAYPPPMMPNEFAGETTQSHRSCSAGRPDNVPWSTVKCDCNFDGRAVIARVHASTSDSPRTGVTSAARGEGEIRMKWGNSEFRAGFMIAVTLTAPSPLQLPR